MKRILLVAVAAAAAAPSARASVCTPYQGGQWFASLHKENTSKAEHGAAINVDTTSLTSGSPGAQFVAHTLTYGVTGNCAYWVGVGVIDGTDGTSSPVRRAIFWADRRGNGGGYHEHFPAVSWRFGAYYQLKVVWAGNNSWNAYFGGVYLGTSTGNYYGGVNRCLVAGIDASRAFPSDHVGGHMFGWARKARNDVWYQDWDGKSLYSTCPADIDVSGNNVTTEVLHGPN
jgi:hypothetical protein